MSLLEPICAYFLFFFSFRNPLKILILNYLFCMLFYYPVYIIISSNSMPLFHFCSVLLIHLPNFGFMIQEMHLSHYQKFVDCV